MRKVQAMKVLAWMQVQIESFLRRRGFVPVGELLSAQAATKEAVVILASEQRRHSDTRRALDEAQAFINEKLQPLTMLEPVMRWPKLHDVRPIDATVEPFAAAHARMMDFMEGRRKDMIIRVLIPAVFDHWNANLRDIRAVDEAIGYVAKAAAHKIAKELRYGMTGDRT